MKLLNEIRKLDINKENKLLLACSYGPDSMALFEMLLKQGYNFAVAHVNYGTRKESNFEEESLKLYCFENGIEFFSKKYVNINKGNFESNAREYRYSFFKEIYNKGKFNFLLTAHHCDDLLETYIMQKTRNIYPFRYGIMEFSKIKGMNVLRPLLRYEKSTLLSFCNKNSIKYSIDSTNLSNQYLRNSIRNTMISKMSVFDKNNMLKEIEKLNVEIEKMYKLFDLYIDDQIGNYTTLNVKNSEVLQRFLFYFLNKNNIEFESSIFKNIIIDINNKNYNKTYNINNNSILISDSESLLIIKKSLAEIDYLYNSETFIDIGSVNEAFFTKNPNCTIQPLKKFKKITCGGISKTTRRFFIDCKMPLSIRLIWPCIVDENNNVIYVPRYRKTYVKNPDSPITFDTQKLIKKHC